MLLIKQVCAIIVSKGGVFVRSVFYSVVNDIKFKEQYYESYYTYAVKIQTGTSIICALASAGSIYAWTQWEELHIIWTILILVSQVVQIVKTYLPYSRRIDALKYIIPEMHRLVLETETCWYRLEKDDNPDYITAIYKYRQKQIDIDVKYLGSDPLPDKRTLRSKAQKATENHLALYFGVVEGGDNDVQQSDPQADSEANEGTRH